MKRKISRIGALNEINKLRIILNEKIAENVDSDEVLKISKKLDTLVNFYYRKCT